MIKCADCRKPIKSISEARIFSKGERYRYIYVCAKCSNERMKSFMRKEKTDVQ